MQIDQNKLSYLEVISKLKLDIEKCKLLHIGFKNIRIEYKFSEREIKRSGM